jgi:large subunit ribosomal protein L47
MLIVDVLGRSWGIQELRERSWEDLHALWHVCVRERNRIATSDLERSRTKAGYGDFESQGRDKVVSFCSGFIVNHNYTGEL